MDPGLRTRCSADAAPTGLPMPPPTGLPMPPPTGLPMPPPATTQQTPPPVTRKNWLLAYAVTAAKDRECIAADGTQAADDVDQKELS